MARYVHSIANLAVNQKKNKDQPPTQLSTVQALKYPNSEREKKRREHTSTHTSAGANSQIPTPSLHPPDSTTETLTQPNPAQATQTSIANPDPNPPRLDRDRTKNLRAIRPLTDQRTLLPIRLAPIPPPPERRSLPWQATNPRNAHPSMRIVSSPATVTVTVAVSIQHHRHSHSRHMPGRGDGVSAWHGMHGGLYLVLRSSRLLSLLSLSLHSSVSVLLRLFYLQIYFYLSCRHCFLPLQAPLPIPVFQLLIFCVRAQAVTPYRTLSEQIHGFILAWQRHIRPLTEPYVVDSAHILCRSSPLDRSSSKRPGFSSG